MSPRTVTLTRAQAREILAGRMGWEVADVEIFWREAKRLADSKARRAAR